MSKDKSVTGFNIGMNNGEDVWSRQSSTAMFISYQDVKEILRNYRGGEERNNYPRKLLVNVSK